MKIGSLTLRSNVCLAPMAGVTDLPFRLLNREFGVGIAFTEMISAVGLTRGAGKTCRYLHSTPEDRPLGVQIFGSDGAVLSEAARIVTDQGFALLDLNMGCPVKKVTRTGAGAALLKDLPGIGSILKAVRGATRLPLTVKIRAGWRRQDINCLQVARLAQDCGVDAIIVHPRTADQGFSGSADWNLIGRVKNQATIPVIGNGDIRTAADALRMIRITGCDGIMVGRGALGNPWLFRGIASDPQGRSVAFPPTLEERERTIRRHLAMMVDFFGESVGLRNFRKHLLWYTKGLRGGAKFRQRIGLAKDGEGLIGLLRELLYSVDQGSGRSEIWP